MSIATYTDLKAAIASWLHRDDVTSLIPDFIRLAEARFNRSLRVRAMLETLDSAELVDGAASLPDGFRAFKELRWDGTPVRTLEPRPLEWIRNQEDSADTPLYFAVTGSQVVCWPQVGSIKGAYYKDIPALADNSTNWLLTAHPDVYLFGSLVESVLYTQDDGRIPLWADKTAALLEQIQAEDGAASISGGPLVARAR